MRKFKVLLVYPNLMLVSTLPNNIALLASCIKKEGHDVKVFDTTLYKTTEITNDELRVERMQVRSFDIKECGVEIKEGDMYEDFVKVVNNYEPDLIAVTMVDDVVQMGLSLINALGDKNIPVVFGGVHVFFNKEELIKNKNINILCVGEGEEAIVELCYALKNGLPIENIKNLWVKKKDGRIVKNQLRPPVDINSLPFEDFTIFDKKRLYRPMQGKMLSTIPINLDRGCPYQCTFCDAPAINKMFREMGCYNYYRQKTIDRIRLEIQYQVKKHNIEYIYFNSETFLAMAMPIEKMKEFAEMYSEFRIPFWCQTRIETITEEKVKLLKEMNCDRISVGIEQGNEDFRKSMLKKFFSNEDVIKAFKILNAYKLKISVNNMIGFPDETRELIFDTIELNRKVKADSINGFIFQPYLGTSLREYCIKKGYLSEKKREIGSSEGTPIGISPLKMPQISQEELEGLLRTFVLYVKMPRSYFSEIKKAEQLNEEGDKALSELREIFFEKYF